MIALDTTGTLGGILILWNDINFKLINSVKGKFNISIQVENKDGFTWWLSAVYGPSNNTDRESFWMELEMLQNSWNLNWLIAEDFNMVRWKEETNAKHLDRRAMDKFNNFIHRNSLIDPPLSNNSFTWSNLRVNPTLSRLDGFSIRAHRKKKRSAQLQNFA